MPFMLYVYVYFVLSQILLQFNKWASSAGTQWLNCSFLCCNLSKSFINYTLCDWLCIWDRSCLWSPDDALLCVLRWLCWRSSLMSITPDSTSSTATSTMRCSRCRRWKRRWHGWGIRCFSCFHTTRRVERWTRTCSRVCRSFRREGRQSWNWTSTSRTFVQMRCRWRFWETTFCRYGICDMCCIVITWVTTV